MSQFEPHLWKFAFGTAALYPEAVLREKVALLRAHGVEPYPGGTLLEVAWVQGRAGDLLRRLWALGFRVVEVSDGTVSMPAGERQRLIRLAGELGFRVIAEVGKKDPAAQPSAAELIRQARADLAEGVGYVIVEARESGRGIGIYDAGGRVREEDLAALAAALPVEQVIWEAPEKAQQEALILRFGPGVNLGNVPPAEALALEALRAGWRGDTLRAALAPPRPRP